MKYFVPLQMSELPAKILNIPLIVKFVNKNCSGMANFDYEGFLSI